jgi:hypothetical protein
MKNSRELEQKVQLEEDEQYKVGKWIIAMKTKQR